jgi:hypothetical protein
MKKTALILTLLILVAILAWFTSIYIAQGGWPASDPSTQKLPPHIEYVSPVDGQALAVSHGFCAHFNYQAGLGLGEEPQKSIRYYLDGFNVSRWVRDLTVLEYGYPAPVGEPCYRAEKPLSTGWHTAKIIYTDAGDHEFSYLWRFQVLDE